MKEKEIMKMKKEAKKVMNNIIVEGTIVSARFGSTKFDDNNKYRIAIESDSIDYDSIHAYDNVGSKLTPTWFKDKTGYINLSSIYDIPIQDVKGKRIDFEEWIGEEYNALGSKVKVSIKQKEGALYPIAIKVIEEGEERDPFEGL